ncbi:MAG: methyltransferase [Candidatus Hadarchaeum sp.]|uniref:HemK2/MTQ2 family protein methyltransferase n=1 Tax=Candidatus Hadarchaeum sp. TaxID=2883567 RepID=UPI00317EEFD8
MKNFSERVKIIFYKGGKFLVYPGVYEPADDTFLIADNLDVKSGERVLELGTGCGLLAILAAKAGAKVVATDISQTALECARANAIENLVSDKIDFRCGDLFDPVDGELFDAIIFNPPYLPVEPEERFNEPLEMAWNGGSNGREVIDRFLNELPLRLRVRGRALFVHSSLSNPSQTVRFLETNHFKFKTVRIKMFFEELFLFQCFRC